MAEQFANKIRTTLAADYTAGSGTCTVADATGMPATGDFRLRLSNVAATILKVTARAGAVLTVTPEQDDGNAPSGTEVRLVPTAGAMLALKADAIAGSGGVPGWPTIVPVVGGDFAWVNQGGATVTDANGISYLVAPTGAGNNLRIRKKTAPATPYTITGLFVPIVRRTDFSDLGLIFRESGTGKILVLRLSMGGAGINIAVTNSTGVTNFTTNRVIRPWDPGTFMWLQVNADGTNLKFRISPDGRNFTELLSQVKTLDFTTAPDEVGYFINNSATGADVVGSVLHWAES